MDGDGRHVHVGTVVLLNDLQELIPEDAILQVIPGVVHCNSDEFRSVSLLLLHQLNETLESGDAFGVQGDAQDQHLVVGRPALVRDAFHELLQVGKVLCVLFHLHFYHLDVFVKCQFNHFQSPWVFKVIHVEE
jgi:hypothetical protein